MFLKLDNPVLLFQFRFSFLVVVFGCLSFFFCFSFQSLIFMIFLAVRSNNVKQAHLVIRGSLLLNQLIE